MGSRNGSIYTTLHPTFLWIYNTFKYIFCDFKCIFCTETIFYLQKRPSVRFLIARIFMIFATIKSLVNLGVCLKFG
jgi:hypothetical protein